MGILRWAVTFCSQIAELSPDPQITFTSQKELSHQDSTRHSPTALPAQPLNAGQGRVLHMGIQFSVVAAALPE